MRAWPRPCRPLARPWPAPAPPPGPPEALGRGSRSGGAGVPGGKGFGRSLGVRAISAAAWCSRVSLRVAAARPGRLSPRLPAHPQRPPPWRAAGTRCRCSGSAAARRGDAASGAAGTPPGHASSRPLGGPAWRGLPGKRRKVSGALSHRPPHSGPRKLWAVSLPGALGRVCRGDALNV